MPRYSYKCYGCQCTFEAVHGILEEQEACISCESKKLKRVPQMPYIHREQTSKGERVGEETKRAIEENRTLLEQEKKIRVEYKDGD